MLIRVKLLKNWGGYKKGSVMDLGESKGRPLIANDTAIEVSNKEKIIKINNLGDGLIRVKLTKTWGGFCVGSVMDLGESKGRTLIDSGMAEEVGKQMKIDKKSPKKKNPKVEVAMIEPKAETAVVTPEKKPKERKKRRERQEEKQREKQKERQGDK